MLPGFVALKNDEARHMVHSDGNGTVTKHRPTSHCGTDDSFSRVRL